MTGNTGIGASLNVNSLANINALNVTGLSQLNNVNATNINAATLTTTGNVAVGSSLTVSSAAALNTLDVSGISTLNGNTGIGASLNVSSIGTFGGLSVSGLSALGNVNANNINALSLTTTGNVGVGGSLSVSSLTSLTTVLTSGNVGIGATNSDNRLDVWGSARITDGLRLEGLNQSSGRSLCVNTFDQVITCSGGGTLTGTGVNGGVAFWTTEESLSSDVSKFYFNSNTDSLGIGTSNPQYTLEVAGNGYISGFLGVGSSLSVAGNTGIGQSLTVSSAANLDSLSVNKSISAASLGISRKRAFGGNVRVGQLPHSHIQRYPLKE